MLIVSLVEEGKPGILEKSEGILPSAEISGKHLPSANSGENIKSNQLEIDSIIIYFASQAIIH